ncbi:MAG TPA: cell division protein FtsZ, partial [Pseudolysinimonas sp.]|nr:cell division protein FtsZ [Pseudolysinimonas sp.]
GDEVRVTVIAAGFDGGEPLTKPQRERRSNFVDAAVPVAVGAGQSAAADTGWAAEPDAPIVAPADRDFDDEDDLDIPDFLK